jgi:hypothetical protein
VPDSFFEKKLMRASLIELNCNSGSFCPAADSAFFVTG